MIPEEDQIAAEAGAAFRTGAKAAFEALAIWLAGLAIGGVLIAAIVVLAWKALR